MGTYSDPKEYVAPVDNQRTRLEQMGWKFTSVARTHTAEKVVNGETIRLEARGCCFKMIAAKVMAWECKNGT